MAPPSRSKGGAQSRSISLGSPSIHDGGRSLVALATRPCLRRTSCVYSRVAVWREGWRAIRPEVGARGGRGPRRRSGGSFLAELCKRTSEAEGPRQDKARRRTGFALDSQVKDIEMSVCVRYAETCFVLALVTRTRASRVTSGSTLVPYDRRSTAPRPRARPPRAEHGGLRGRVRSLRSPRRARSADRDGRCSGRSGAYHINHLASQVCQQCGRGSPVLGSLRV